MLTHMAYISLDIGVTRYDEVHGKVQLYKWHKSAKNMELRESWYQE